MQPRIKRRSLARQLDEAIAEIQTLRTENASLSEKLYIDELTGTANRRAFKEKLAELVEVAKTSGEPLALLVADIDGLKRANDSLGHTKGDEILKTTAQALLACSRETDLVGRISGDEFYVILPGFSPAEGQSQKELLAATTKRYQRKVNRYLTKLRLPVELAVNLSLGITILEASESTRKLFNRADKICQANKQKFYNELKSSGVIFRDERL